MTDDNFTPGQDIDADLDKYYYYLMMITENVRNGYNFMVTKYSAMSLPLIPSLIEKSRSSGGEFDRLVTDEEYLSDVSTD